MRKIRLPWRCAWCRSLRFLGERRWSSWGWVCKTCAGAGKVPGA